MILSRNALAVMLGGGAGAVCRVMMGLAVMEKLPSGFPLGVLCANVLGGFLMGLLQGWMRRTATRSPRVIVCSERAFWGALPRFRPSRSTRFCSIAPAMHPWPR